ncbi:MAG: hypothetical protein ACLFP2_05120 [Candidatus Woesearchaeota archaeon]
MAVKIIEPSDKIFELIEICKKEVQAALPKARITLIGSFAVPMCGKEEFDLLIEVDKVRQVQQNFKKIGFGVGPIIGGEGFCKKKVEGIVC